jgi:hypothetical protein
MILEGKIPLEEISIQELHAIHDAIQEVIASRVYH